MAKILVADDNSNIQKMVGLALKDQGIDVVAVGNGEAAVRKISDVQPDLVLADVFMPVRNGYEVCEYVKADTALSHIPVILLVGAFDPLDEQEAQRVGADGVLKKPFVPPDPLISMVKSALARAGVSYSSEKNAGPADAPRRVSEEPRSHVATFPSVELPPEAANESFVEEVPARPAPLQFRQGEQPLAFGSMLESPAAEPEETVDEYIPPPAMALERDWHSNEEEIEEEEEEPKASWRRDGADDAFTAADSVPAVPDWREAAFKHAEAPQESRSNWAPAEEKPAGHEAASTSGTVHALTPEALSFPAEPSFTGDAWAAAISAGSDSAVSAIATQESRGVAPQQEISEEEAAPAPPVEPVAVQAPTAPNPWDAEAQKATQLASTWDVPAPVAPSAPPTGASSLPEAMVEETQAALPVAAVEAVREEMAQVQEAPAKVAAPEAVATKAVGDVKVEPNAEDVVAKVLAKLSPEVLQAVTRDILKPVIESIVRDELGQKK